MGDLKLAVAIKNPRNDAEFLLEKQKQPAKFGDQAYDSFVDSDLWDLPSTDLPILEGEIKSGIALSIAESCSEEVDLKNFDVESTLNRLLANLGFEISDVGEWRFVRYVEEPEFGPDSSVRTCFITGKLLDTYPSPQVQTNHKWMSMEACFDCLIDAKPGSDRVGPLVLLGLGDGSRQSMKEKFSTSLPIQEYPPGVMLVPMRSRTLKPFKTTNLVVFAPENGSGLFLQFAMDELPPELLVKILNRLNDSADVARCRIASKTLNSLWREVRAVNLICTLPWYLKARSNGVTPFKTVFKNLIEDSPNIRSVSLGIYKALSSIPFADLNEEDSDELFLADAKFAEEWLPRVREKLEILSISDFWIQSCWRQSNILGLISPNCSKLVKLEVKNAWLSVAGLTQMPNLRDLTLEFLRLDDENLDKIHDCFPFLQVLNLIGVGGLKKPRIRFLHLKSCHWAVSNAPLSLAVVAPNLLVLKLKCDKPKSLLIETPKLVKLHLTVEDTKGVSFAEIRDLNTLELKSPDMHRIIKNTHFGSKIRNLAVDSLKSIEQSESLKLGLGTLLEAFPGVVSLSLSPVTWSNIETHFQSEGLVHMNRNDTLKRITTHVLTPGHTNLHQTVSFIRSILSNCTSLTDMRLMIHQDTDRTVRNNLISACRMSNPRVRWKWGMWAEAEEILVPIRA